MNHTRITSGICVVALAVGCASNTASTTPTTPSLERPTSPQTLRKGETHEVEIQQGQRHEWGIQLAAGEHVTLSIRATSTGATLCQNWTWGFYNPAGGALREQPQVPREDGVWSADIEGTAEASVTEGPTAGRYLVRVEADATSCPQLHYTLRAR